MVLDIIVALILLAAFVYVHRFSGSAEPLPIAKVIFHILFWWSEVLIGCNLALAVIYLTKFIKTVTGNKPNLCLIIWHIVNVFIYAAILILLFIANKKQTDAMKE